MLVRLCVQGGTEDYAAPEQLGQCLDGSGRPKYPITLAVDVFAFGLLLWEIVTGVRPNRFKGALRLPR